VFDITFNGARARETGGFGNEKESRVPGNQKGRTRLGASWGGRSSVRSQPKGTKKKPRVSLFEPAYKPIAKSSSGGRTRAIRLGT